LKSSEIVILRWVHFPHTAVETETYSALDIVFTLRYIILSLVSVRSFIDEGPPIVLSSHALLLGLYREAITLLDLPLCLLTNCTSVGAIFRVPGLVFTTN